MKPLVIQSFRTSDVPPWIERCLGSVRVWAEHTGWKYRFIGDEILELVPQWYRENAGGRFPIITDLARLLVARDALQAGSDVVVWIDADVLIFDPDSFDPSPAGTFAFAREIWIQKDTEYGQLKVFRNVHNAVCAFRRDNVFLDFYIYACEAVMRRVGGRVPDQIVGTKLLTAFNNIVGFELLEDVGMVSPGVAREIVEGAGPALRLLCSETRLPLRAVNLCNSLRGYDAASVAANDALLSTVVDRLLAGGRSIFSNTDADL